MSTSGAGWRTGTHTTSNGRVEVTFLDGRVAIRDSNDPEGPVLMFTPVEWEAFVGGVRLGEFDLSLLGDDET